MKTNEGLLDVLLPVTMSTLQETSCFRLFLDGPIVESGPGRIIMGILVIVVAVIFHFVDG